MTTASKPVKAQNSNAIARLTPDHPKVRKGLKFEGFIIIVMPTMAKMARGRSFPTVVIIPNRPPHFTSK